MEKNKFEKPQFQEWSFNSDLEEDVNFPIHNEKFQFLINKNQEFSFAKKNQKRDPMVDSDEEIEKELTNAIQLHRKNIKQKSAPSPQIQSKENVPLASTRRVEVSKAKKHNHKKNETKNSNQIDRSKCEEFLSEIDQVLKFFKVENKDDECDSNFYAKNSVNIIDYTKQGAIPKKQKMKSNDFATSQHTEKKSQLKNSGRKKKTITTQNEKKDLERNVFFSTDFCEPFYYIVPENPAPNFFFPAGSYYIIPKKVCSSLSENIILHPDHEFQLKSTGNSEQKKEENNLTDHIFKEFRKLNEEDLVCSEYNMNIRPLKEIGSVGSKDILNLFEDKKEHLEEMKTILQGNIQILKSALLQSNEALKEIHAAETSFNIASNLKPKQNLYEKSFSKKEYNVAEEEKKIEDHITILKVLFPKLEESYLKEKVKEFNKDEKLFESFIVDECKRSQDSPDAHKTINEEFRRLLSELPTYGTITLYKAWVQYSGDQSKLLEYIEKKKKENIRAIVLAEFPDSNENFVQDVVEVYYADLGGLEEFIALERLNRKIFSQLERMRKALPDINADELERKCLEFDGNEELVTEYIEKVIHENEMSEKVFHIQSIIPDVDTDFIYNKIKELKENRSMNDLIDSLLESGHYPKMIDSEDKNNKLWEKYVVNFNVKDFLLIVPNPQKFLDIQRPNNEDNELIVKFFESRFPNVSLAHFENTYRRHNFSLALTCSYIEKNFATPNRLIMTNFKEESFNEDFLQEISYIDHREEITNHLTEIEDQRQLEKQEALLYNAFLSCPLCADDEVIGSEVVTCPEGHIFCKSCITRFVEVKLGDGVYRFCCPYDNCETYFALSTLQQLLPFSTYSKILKKQQAEEIHEANIDGLESCPFCEFAYIPNINDNIFRCRNIDCLAEICRKCGEKNHIPKRCEEIERSIDVEARKKIEESMTKKLIRHCPKCHKKFVKIDGCNKIVCVCGTMSCYLCGQEIYGYSHFKEYGPVNSCPLYSQNKDLHIQDVLNAGIETRNAILEENPDIRIFHDPATELLK